MEIRNFSVDEKTYEEWKGLCESLDLNMSARIRRFIEADIEELSNQKKVMEKKKKK